MKTINFFFGSAKDFPVSHFDADAFVSHAEQQLMQQLGLKHIIFDRQVHGIAGRVINKVSTTPVEWKTHEGDYAITAQPGIGLAVLTADCLPLVFYSPDKNIVAVAHAGWRGSMLGIGPTIIKRLQEEFGVDVGQLKVWFGPAGKVCCYEVKDDFVAQIPEAALSNLHKRDGKLFFDNTQFNRQLLLATGIDAANIDLSHNDCTICNHSYHSFRRSEDKARYKTQATAVWLT